jgi:TetR/AcrR family transcriptional regulator, transcriptional repressor for nem operon
MVGVKKFDRSAVLERAMTAFWTRGYEATSIDDLVAATGINRGSLYGTFGDKQGLFLAALDHYWHTVVTAMMAALSDPDPRRAIEGMFEALIQRTSDPRFPRGCLITNTSLECPSCGDDIARKITERLGQQETAIYHVLRKAQTEGALSVAHDARALARFFVGVAWGINAVNRTVADPEALRDMVRVAMTVWETAGTVQGKGPRVSERHPRTDAQRLPRKSAAVRGRVPHGST